MVTHFAAVERDLEEVLRHPYTAGIIWIGHSDPLGGVLDANGRKIPKSTFNNISRSVATMFLFLAVLNLSCFPSMASDRSALKSTCIALMQLKQMVSYTLKSI
ncbi:MAG: hypothetical protein IPL83_06475 [Bdellovibrionales bacterium]|nr:hypothetical protein [Bdellovibrionales bacterium]